MPWTEHVVGKLNAPLKLVPFGQTLKQTLVRMTTSVSTRCFNSSMPDSALRMRVLPSKANGLVTTAMVRIPMSRAISATTGAAPVPCAAAHAGRHEHQIRALERAGDLLAALLSGLLADFRRCARAETLGQLFRRSGSSLPRGSCGSARTSVFTAMKSTPTTPQSTMRLSAFRRRRRIRRP